MAKLVRIVARESDLVGWSDRKNLAFLAAEAWARYMPRGKGWVPRRLGQAFCRPMKATIETKYGSVLAVCPEALDVYVAILVGGGTWEPRILDACRRILSPGNVFYDIGANVGYFSIELARLFGDRLNVMSFEPQPALCRTIAISAALNGLRNLNVYEVMLGRSDGYGDLFVPEHCLHASSVSREAGARSIRCLKITLDSVIAAGHPPPDLIKMDVEGGELDVIRGARETLKRHAPSIIFESNGNTVRFGYTRRDLVDAIAAEAAYEFFFVDDGDFVPVTSDRLNDTAYTDMLAVPTDRARAVLSPRAEMAPAGAETDRADFDLT